METLSTYHEKLLESVDALDVPDRDRVLAFAQALKETKPGPKGIRGREFVEVIKSLNFTTQDIEEMERSIEEECERVDPDE